MNKAYVVDKLSVDGTKLHLVVDGSPYQIELSEQSALLREAPREALKRIEVSPSGYGLH